MRAILIGPLLRKKDRKLLRQVGVSSKNSLVIAVDGGLKSALSVGLRPDLVVGDWDSLKKGSSAARKLTRFPRLDLPHDKDRSDLFFAITSAVLLGAWEVHCFGVSGGRPDHHQAMLMDLGFFAARADRYDLRRLEVHGPEARYVFLSGKMPLWREKLKKGQLLSVFSLGGDAKGVTLAGVEYPLVNSILEPSSHGLSNQALRKGSSSVSVRQGALVVILPR